MKKRLPKTLSQRELDALFDAPSRRSILGMRARCVLRLMGIYGLRVSEVCNLRLADLRLAEERPYVRVIGKGDKERRIFLGGGIVDLLVLWLEWRPGKTHNLFPVIKAGIRTFGEAEPGRAISTNSVRNMVKGFAEKAGIDRHVTPHMLRHTAATIALRKGENLRDIQEMLGHADLSTTQIYTKVSGKNLSEMAERLDPEPQESS